MTRRSLWSWGRDAVHPAQPDPVCERPRRLRADAHRDRLAPRPCVPQCARGALGGQGFVRIHRSTLVSLAHVTEVSNDAGRAVVRVGDVELQVSRRHPRPARPTAATRRPVSTPDTGPPRRVRITSPRREARRPGERGPRPRSSRSRPGWARSTCPRCSKPSCGCPSRSSSASLSWSSGCRPSSSCARHPGHPHRPDPVALVGRRRPHLPGRVRRGPHLRPPVGAHRAGVLRPDGAAVSIAQAGILAIAVVCAVTLVAGALGLRLSRTTSDYVAGRSVSAGWNASAIGGEYLSAASFLGIAGLVYALGADMLWFPVGYTVGYVVLLVLVAAPLRRSGAYTPDFAEARLESRRVRTLASLLVIGIGWLYLLPQFQGAGDRPRVTGAPPALGTSSSRSSSWPTSRPAGCGRSPWSRPSSTGSSSPRSPSPPSSSSPCGGRAARRPRT